MPIKSIVNKIIFASEVPRVLGLYFGGDEGDSLLASRGSLLMGEAFSLAARGLHNASCGGV